MAWRSPIRVAFYLHMPDLTEVKNPRHLSTDTARHAPLVRPYTVLSEWSSFEAEAEKFAEEQTRKFPDAVFKDRRELDSRMSSVVYHATAESKVAELFSTQVLTMTWEVLWAMSCPGFHSESTSTSVYGCPDMTWTLDYYSCALMCIEVKCPWHLTNVTNIVEQCASEDCDEKLRASVEQIYGYMWVSSRTSPLESIVCFLFS